MTYVQPHLIQAHANLISAPHSSKQRETNSADVAIAALNVMGRRNPAAATGSAAGTTTANTNPVNTPLRKITSASSGDSGYIPQDIKITGRLEDFRPDDESVWDAYKHQWSRPWLPGEKEAEALDRILGVKDSHAIDLDTKLGINKAALDRNKTVNDIYRDAQLKLNALSSSPKLSEQMQYLKDTAFAAARRISQGYGVGETATSQSSHDSYYSDLLKDAGERVQYDPNNMQSVGTDATSESYWDDDKTVVVRDGNFGW